MSRVGRAPIRIPKGVELKLEGEQIKVKGPKGQLTVPLSPSISLAIENDEVKLSRASDHRTDRALHGLVRNLLKNAIIGVTQGFIRNLEVRGVGYRAQMKGSQLELSLGFSHPVVIAAPAGIKIETPEQTKISVSGIDKQLVGQVAANIRAVRSPDSYHGKGVRYEGEHIRLKPGKAAAR